jgi:hypothetical protein
MAYALGFIMADGSINTNNRGANYVSLHSADRDLIFLIKKILKSDHKVSIRRSDTGKVFRVQIGSYEIVSDLRKLGVTSLKAHTMGLPKVPKKYFGQFVRGYFDGDGNVWTGFVHKERNKPLFAIQTVFTSCSKNFLLSLQTRLSKYNIRSQLTCASTYFRLSCSILSSLELYKLMYSNDNQIHLKRKKQVFERYINMRP